MLLCLDVAFASLGFVVINPLDNSLKSMGVLTTQKESKKRNVRVASDDIRRCQELSRKIYTVISTYDIMGIAAEFPHGGAQNSRASRSMGMATAIIASVIEFTELPLEEYTPNEVKMGTVGRRNASKEQVADEVMGAWPEIEVYKPKGQREHITDAAGVAYIAREGSMYRMLKSQAKLNHARKVLRGEHGET